MEIKSSKRINKVTRRMENLVETGNDPGRIDLRKQCDETDELQEVIESAPSFICCIDK